MPHVPANGTDPSRWAVVIPSYNHAADAIICVRSLWDATPRPGRVLLVDDASTEDAAGEIGSWAQANSIPCSVASPSQLRDNSGEFGWLTIVAVKENAGFVRTCNIGLRYIRDQTQTPYVLLLNNDAAVAPNYFEALQRAVAEHPTAGLLSGLIYEWDRSTVWYAGARFNPLRALATHDVTNDGSSTTRETGYICGCTMLISRGVLEKVGVLAECFEPCYVEDVDYSLRASAAGYPLIYAPQAVAYHRVGTSLGRTQQSPRTVFSVNRNRAFTLRRNYRGWRRVMGMAYLAVTKPGRALLELVRGRPKIAKAVLSGMLTGLFSPLAYED